MRQRSRKSLGNREPVSSAQAGETTKILLVEDNQIVAGAVAETLEMKGWVVETYADGISALEKISGEADYDLFVFDYHLPGVSGIELVQKARQLAHRSNTPIVMFSASPVEAEAREVAADAFLRKPEDIGSMVDTISRLIGQHEQEN